MNRKIFYAICAGLVLLVFVIAMDTFDVRDQLEQTRFESIKEAQALEEAQEAKVVEVPIQTIEGLPYVNLDTLASSLGGAADIDQLEGTASYREPGLVLNLVRDTPMVEKNGLYLPNGQKTLFKEDAVWIPASIMKELNDEVVFGTEYAQVIVKDSRGTSLPVNQAQAPIPEQLSDQQLISYLSFLKIPIDGAHISKKPSHLPGAPRTYRNGTHEGIDWYAGTSGINITENTPVKSMADGIVVRADHDYVEFTLEEREKDLVLSSQSSHTPIYILDKLRGRSVWVQYDKGVMVRYAHLSKVEPGLTVGQAVSAGDVIGYVGNSGTSYGVEGSLGGLHLHSDILIYGRLFWEYVKAEELPQILEQLFHS
ncbi:M23 family metallopeptidase [Ammoniphilus sp. YIM 78166]|uniref:M23 family metallopeptidase n=1 Tax=Ammoniphilus sp. YIM 78166 TaxID=1644106 RepID=UPI00106F460A|nr:M23 family metallopeptidase [Ammoniphilus sp. YIM 78166]